MGVSFSVARGSISLSLYTAAPADRTIGKMTLIASRHYRLSAADSRRCGRDRAAGTDLRGVRDYLGGIVAYATDAKAALLGVDREVLAAESPVSEATAGAMAEGARRAFGADLGLATTGVAGPTEQDGRPVGTLCLGVADAAGTATATMRAPGDRAQVRAWAATVALDLLRRRLEGLA